MSREAVFHDVLGGEIKLCDDDVTVYRPRYVASGATVTLTDGRTVDLVESFHELHTFLYPPVAAPAAKTTRTRTKAPYTK